MSQVTLFNDYSFSNDKVSPDLQLYFTCSDSKDVPKFKNNNDIDDGVKEDFSPY